MGGGGGGATKREGGKYYPYEIKFLIQFPESCDCSVLPALRVLPVVRADRADSLLNNQFVNQRSVVRFGVSMVEAGRERIPLMSPLVCKAFLQFL